MTSPLVSVIIPCHNDAKHIEKALCAMLCQTYNNIEIIIIDDHSTDNTQDILKPYLEKYKNISYIKMTEDDPQRFNAIGTNINAGWMARNYGFKFTKGDLITFQDADDGSCSNRLQVQYDMMIKYNSNHVVVDWQKYEDNKNCKEFIYQITDQDIIKSDEIIKLAKKTKNILFCPPFKKDWGKGKIGHYKRRLWKKTIAKLIDWTPYPCAASMPLFKREVLEKCKFRQLYQRTRPSEKGRGADRDFNFWIAETFRNSIAIKIPLVLWRVKNDNPNYLNTKNNS